MFDVVIQSVTVADALKRKSGNRRNEFGQILRVSIQIDDLGARRGKTPMPRQPIPGR